MDSGIILLDGEDKTTDREGDFRLPNEIVCGRLGQGLSQRPQADAPKAGHIRYEASLRTPFWNNDKAPGQIVKCAEADALRSTFPTLLGGLHTEHEIVEIHSEVRAMDMPVGRFGSPNRVRERQADAPALESEPEQEGPASSAPKATVRKPNSPFLEAHQNRSRIQSRKRRVRLADRCLRRG